MNRQERLDTFEFDDDAVFYHEVYTETALNPNSFVDDRNHYLLLEIESPFAKFVCH